MNEIKKYIHKEDIQLESGSILPELTIAYTTYGKRNASDDNIVWICHALTANSNAEDWWSGLVGKGCVVDPDKFFIVCTNALGSFYGTTGPRSLNPLTGKPYGMDFPKITVKDVSNVNCLLAKHLSITKIDLLLGGSFGGSQALEMAFSKEISINKIILIATGAKESARNIAIHESQRLALAADPTLIENEEDSGKNGLKAARAIGLLTYRTYDAFELQQADHDHRTDDFRAASYIQYQGDKLVKRFHAHNYWHLTKCMDTHDIGRNRGGIENALGQIKIPTTVIGINTDELIPTIEQKFIQQHIPDCSYHEISSDYGHDGFLIETTKIGNIINKQLNKPTTNKTIKTMVKEITVTELKELFDNKDDFQLIDVREPFETEIATIGGELIPQGQVLNEHNRVSTDKKVVIYCRSGVRSANAIEALQHLNGFDNLYNLKGGILAWADEIDASIQKY